MDIVERVARALYDMHDGEAFDTAEPTYDELDDQIKGWYMEQAETSLAASGVAELVEALEFYVFCVDNDWSTSDAYLMARKVRARYRGEA